MFRWSRLLLVLVFQFTIVFGLLAQDTKYVPGGATAWDPTWQQIPGPNCLEVRGAWEGGSTPCSPDDHPDWLADVTHWREERRIRIGFDPSRYELPALKWTQSSFIQPQMMVQDRYFYDPVAAPIHRRSLSRRSREALWRHRRRAHLVDLSQHGHRRPQPARHGPLHARRRRRRAPDGGRLSPPRRARALPHDDVGPGHARSRASPGRTPLPSLMEEIGADGINGDTQDGVPLAFSWPPEKTGHPLAFEPEGGPHDEAVAWNVMTWGQYHFPFVPTVDRFKWLEPRHMVNISDRWNREQDRRSAIRLLQRRRLGELGERLGHLERHHSARCRSHAPRRHHRARHRAFPRQPGLGAVLSHAPFRRLRQPLAARRRDRLDHRQSQRIRRDRRPDGTARPKMACATSISITALN